MMNYFWSLQEVLNKSLPNEIRRAISKLAYEKANDKFSILTPKKQALLAKLRQYCNLSIFGYNSGMALNFKSIV